MIRAEVFTTFSTNVDYVNELLELNENTVISLNENLRQFTKKINTENIGDLIYSVPATIIPMLKVSFDAGSLTEGN